MAREQPDGPSARRPAAGRSPRSTVVISTLAVDDLRIATSVASDAGSAHAARGAAAARKDEMIGVI